MKKIYYLFLAAFLVPALMFAQEPANSDCANATIQTLVTDGPTVSVTGSGTDAVDLDELGAAHVWEAFTIDACSDVIIDLCGTTVTVSPVFAMLADGCPLDQTVNVTITPLDANYELCGEDELQNPTLFFVGLPAGTYYYPVLSDPDPELGVVDDYTVNFTAVTCEPEPDSCMFFLEGPYSDLNTAWEGAPVPDANGVCPTYEFDTFEVLASEAYFIEDFTVGADYTFSICNGPNAGSWTPALTVFEVIEGNLGSVVAYSESCSITWTAGVDFYVIAIAEAGACYNTQNTGAAGLNGYPSLSCEGPNTGLSETDKATFSVYPNPSNGQFTIGNVDVAGSYTIEVIDLAGRVIHSQVSALSSNTETRVNLNEVAAGVYMVKMINTNSNTQAVQRIVIK